MWYCYILRCIDEGKRNLTYNGSTNNIYKRLRQHNGQISGGAKATNGKQWEVYSIIIGCVDHSHNLSLEWAIKHIEGSGKKHVRPAKYCGVAGRIKGLSRVLLLDKWTQQCTIENKTCNYTLYIVEEMLQYLDLDEIPDNIDIYTISKMTPKFLESLIE